MTIDAIAVDDCNWPDRQKLADWFKATLGEADWRARIANAPGAAFSDGVKRKQFWRDDETLREHIGLKARLSDLTATTYAEQRFTVVQSALRPLGVPLSRSSQYFSRFMAACLKAEVEYLDLLFDRGGVAIADDGVVEFGDEIGEAGIDNQGSASEHFLDGWRRLFERRQTLPNVMRVYGLHRRHIDIASVANAETPPRRNTVDVPPVAVTLHFFAPQK